VTSAMWGEGLMASTQSCSFYKQERVEIPEIYLSG